MNYRDYISLPTQQLALDPYLEGFHIHQQWFDDLQRYDRTQFTVTNQSQQLQQVRLWGGNQGSTLAQANTVISTGNYPQSVLFSPFTGWVYVSHQLNNTISAFDRNGNLQATTTLEPQFPGFSSPVSQAADFATGRIFVAGSISNRVYILDADLRLIATVSVDARPVAVMFNPFNDQLYVAHLVGQKVTVIDASNYIIKNTLAVGVEPMAVSLNPASGQWVVVNSGDNTIHVFDLNDQLLGVIPNIGQTPVAANFHPFNQRLYAVTTGSQELIEVDVQSLTVTATVGLSGKPRTIYVTPNTGQILVGNTENETVSIYNQNLQLQLTAETPGIGPGIAADDTSNLFWWASPLSNSVGIGDLMNGTGNSIEVSENYDELVTDFQFNPAVLRHVKAIFSGDTIAPIIRIGSGTPTGIVRSWALSMSNHQSPQKRLNIAELIELENEIIDGQTFWDVQLLPGQRLTLLLYYNQYHRETELQNVKNDLWNGKREKDGKGNAIGSDHPLRPRATGLED